LVRKTQELASCVLTSKCGKLNKMSETNNKTQIPGPTLPLLPPPLLLPPHTTTTTTTTIHVVEMQLSKQKPRIPASLVIKYLPHTTTTTSSLATFIEISSSF
jgi:hypothetical protein